MKFNHHHRQQRGVTLIVALIMLVALAMLAVWGVNTSTANMRIVGNTQSRQETLSAAQTALETTLSSTLFVKGTAGNVDVDIDGDGTIDYNVALSPKPSCYRVRVIKVTELDPNSTSDLSCLGSSSATTSGIEVDGSAPPTGDSLCADSDWNIRAVATDIRTGASVAANQGISLRSLSTDTANNCT